MHHNHEPSPFRRVQAILSYHLFTSTLSDAVLAYASLEVWLKLPCFGLRTSAPPIGVLVDDVTTHITPSTATHATFVQPYSMGLIRQSLVDESHNKIIRRR
jgi:hypothetical protein